MSRILKQVSFSENSESDLALLAHLDQQKAISVYIKELIRRDMAGELSKAQAQQNSDIKTAVDTITQNSNKNTTALVDAISQLAGVLQGNLIVQPTQVSQEQLLDIVEEEEETAEEQQVNTQLTGLLNMGGF